MTMTDPIADMLTRLRNGNAAYHDDIDTTRGMDVTIVTTATNDDEGRALLLALGFPLRQDAGGLDG